MRVLMLVAIGIGFRRRASHASGGANETFVAEPCLGARRPHERLVVEARGEKARKRPNDGARIEGERWPAILARRDEAVKKLERGLRHIGFRALPTSELHQR